MGGVAKVKKGKRAGKEESKDKFLPSQLRTFESPVSEEYVPAGQFWHSVTPLAFENLPEPQRMQSLSSVLPSVARYLPATQRIQLSSAVLPSVGKYLPAPHVWHTSELVASATPEYLPDGQAEQSEDSNKVQGALKKYPGSQPEQPGTERSGSITNDVR